MVKRKYQITKEDKARAESMSVEDYKVKAIDEYAVKESKLKKRAKDIVSRVKIVD